MVSRCWRSTQYWYSPGTSPVSAPCSNMLMTTTFISMGFCWAKAQVVAASRKRLRIRRMNDGNNSGYDDGGVERSEITEPRVVAALPQCGIPATERVERDHDECPDEVDER